MKRIFETKEEYLAIVSKMKEDYKLLSKGLREDKYDYKQIQRKELQKPYPDIEKEKSEARALHIIYSLLKGNTYNQIENKVREGNEPNPYFLKKVCSKYNLPYEEFRTEIYDEAIHRSA